MQGSVAHPSRLVASGKLVGGVGKGLNLESSDYQFLERRALILGLHLAGLSMRHNIGAGQDERRSALQP